MSGITGELDVAEAVECEVWLVCFLSASAQDECVGRISIAQMMQPEHANPIGNVHGGWIMKLVDECAALACMRHARQRVVTVAVDSMTFRQP